MSGTRPRRSCSAALPGGRWAAAEGDVPARHLAGAPAGGHARHRREPVGVGGGDRERRRAGGACQHRHRSACAQRRRRGGGGGDARHDPAAPARVRGAARGDAGRGRADRGGLAHEIRNPLGAIRGAVQLHAARAGRRPRFGEYTDVLLKEVDRVNRIIEMLLDIGRPVTLRPVPLNVHQLLERVALLAEEMAASAGCRSCGATTQPAAHPGRRGSDPAGLPQPGAQRGGGDGPRAGAHPRHPPQHEPALRQGGPRATASAAWPRSR